MVTVRFICACLVAAASVPALAADREDLAFELAENLPEEIIAPLGKFTKLAYDARLNPFYLQADFDGDGARDTAVLVKERKSGKAGIAIVLKSRVVVIAAGTAFNEGDDFDWVNSWRVERKGKVGMGADESPPPKLKGDAILASRLESSSGLIYWDGKRFRWYQQGD